MKSKATVPVWICLITAAVLIIGSATVLGPCVHEDGSAGVCHDAGTMILALGAVLLVQSLLAILISDQEKKTGILIAMLPTAVLGMLIPGTVLPICSMATMQCRAVMQPAALVLFGIIAFTCLVHTISTLLRKSK